ncbi:MAG: MFS transporter [Archangium sp.]|nr:MFS transporter [Archangium sp.]
MSTAAVPFTATIAQGLPRSFWFLLTGMFINRLGGFVVPLLMLYLTQQRDISLQSAGFVVSLYGAGLLVGNAAGGAMADRFGRRFTLLLSLTLSAASMLAMSVAYSLPALAAGAVVLGGTTSMYQPVTQTVINDVVPAEHRLRAFTYTYWVVNLGFSLALVVGGLMAEHNFTWLFVGDAVTTLLFALVVYLAVPETRPAPIEGDDRGSVLTPFVDPRYVPFLFLCFTTFFVFFQHVTMLPLDMVKKGLSTADYGLAIASNGVLIVLLQPFASQWVRRGSRARWLALAALFTGVGFGVTALASSLGAYVATIALWTVGEVLMAPLNMSVVADVSPTSMRGRYQGAFHLTWSLATLVAPTVTPLVIEATSSAGLWALCLVLGVLVALGHLVLTSRLERPLHEAMDPEPNA